MNPALEAVYNLAVEAGHRATVVEMVGCGPKTRFLIADKEHIMRLMREASLTFSEVCMHFAGKGMNYSTWQSRFYAWQKDFERGKLDVGLAIAVQRAQRKPRPTMDDIIRLVELDQMIGCMQAEMENMKEQIDIRLIEFAALQEKCNVAP